MDLQHEERLTRVEARCKSNSRRLDAVEEKQTQLNDMVTSMALIAQKQNTMEKDMGEIKKDLKTIADKPGKRWESVVEKAILAAVAILVTYIAVRLGLQ